MAESDASLAARDTYYDERGDCWTLVQVPDDEQQQKRILERLGALEWKGLVSAAEHGQGKRPPKSGRRP